MWHWQRRTKGAESPSGAVSTARWGGVYLREVLLHCAGLSLEGVECQGARHVVFHGAVLVQVYAGFMRARAPLEDTDRPFILTLLALMVIAIMPPPAVALVGPLCSPVRVTWEPHGSGHSVLESVVR